MTETDAYQMGDIKLSLYGLARKKLNSTFDRMDWSQKVEPADEFKPLTVVSTVLGILQYTRLPQGLQSKPGTFQRIVIDIL